MNKAVRGEPSLKLRFRYPLIGGAVILLTFVLLDYLQPSIVRGASMLPALHDGDRILVECVTPKLGAIGRGDVVVLEPPGADGDRYVKRVMALPGDVVREEHGGVFVNGDPVARGITNPEPHRWVIPANCYFVMGDNTDHSFDSRMFGPVPQTRIIGRVVGK